MAYRSVMLNIVADCPRCGLPIPVPGASEMLACPHCRGATATPASFWRWALSEPITEALDLPVGKGRSGTLHGSPKLHIVYGATVIRCGECRARLPVEGLAEAAEIGTGVMFCPECGNRNSVRAVPDWLRATCPAAAALVGESLDPKPAKSEIIHCYKCTAPIRVDDSGADIRCAKCGEHLSLPGDVKRRLAQPSEGRWFVLFDLGTAEGVLPPSLEQIVDFGIDPYGRMLLAWREDPQRRGTPQARLALVDHKGLLVWIQRGLDFSSRTTLHANPGNGRLLMVDPARRKCRYIDPVTGAAGEPFADGNDETGLLASGHDHVAMVVDADGTLLELKRERDALRLRRFDAHGMRVHMWVGLKLGDEEKLAKKKATSWSTVGDRALRLPSDALVTAGWDGHLYVTSTTKKQVHMYASDGRRLGTLDLPPDMVETIKDVGVDKDGRLIVLFTHAKTIGSLGYDHVARMGADGKLSLWLGPHADDSPVLLAPDVGRMKIMPDGTVFMGDSMEQLRIIRPSGAVAWESPMVARAERRNLERLSRGLRRQRQMRS